jgi:ubiquinone/menaquinone biosynthesis C-methylase UbiE
MIKKAKVYLKGVDIKLVLADAFAYINKLKKNSVDIITSGFVFHNMPRAWRAKMFKAIFAALKPGGVFINADKMAPDDEKKHRSDFIWQMKRIVQAHISAGRDDLAREWLLHYLRDNQPEYIFTEKEAREVLKKIGFAQVKIFGRSRMDAAVVAKK